MNSYLHQDGSETKGFVNWVANICKRDSIFYRQNSLQCCVQIKRHSEIQKSGYLLLSAAFSTPFLAQRFF